MSESTERPDPQGQEPIDALKARIRASSTAVRDGQNTGHDTLLFLNTRYESFPLSVQTDFSLSPAARTVFNQLWIWAKTKQGGGLAASLFPDYEWLMRAANMSRGSVASCITQLRLSRYITLHRKVRNENSQFVGNDFILNDEPLSLADTLALDEDYIEFVRKSSKHRHVRVQQMARIALDAINKHMEVADDPLAPQTHLEKVEARQQAHLIIQRRLFPELVDPNAPEPESWYGIPVEAYEAAIRQVHIVNADDEESQVHIVNAAESSQVHFMNAAPEPSQVHNVNAAQTASDQRVHNVNAEVNAEVNSSSSSSNKNTTTTEAEFTETTETEPALQADLVYPEFKYPQERSMCELLVAQLPPEDQQPMLDELAGRLADRSKEPINNTIGYLRGMIRKHRQGEFVFSTYSIAEQRKRAAANDVPVAHPADHSARIREIQSEIAHLDRMISQMQTMGAADADRAALDEQRNSLQAELDELMRQQALAAG